MGQMCTPAMRFQIHMMIATELLDSSPNHAMEAAIEAFKAAREMGRRDLMTDANDVLRAALAIDGEGYITIWVQP